MFSRRGFIIELRVDVTAIDSIDERIELLSAEQRDLYQRLTAVGWLPFNALKIIDGESRSAAAR